MSLAPPSFGETGGTAHSTTTSAEPCADQIQATPPGLELRRSHDFRRHCLAVAASKLGDAFPHVALM